jgi:molybdate transport system substrate-binding protein
MGRPSESPNDWFTDRLAAGKLKKGESMQRSYRSWSKCFAVILLLTACTGTRAADIQVLSTNGLKHTLEKLAPEFETMTKHKLALQFAPAADMKGRIEKGEAFDLTFLTSAAIDDLIKQGRLVAATRTDIAKAGAGVAIRRGASRPDITTADAFKRTMLGARSITYVATGATGATMRRAFEQLGIADEMKARTRLVSGVSAAAAVANGDAELGFSVISEILGVEGVELAGPLPPEVQVYLVFPAAVSSNARSPDAAESFIRFLTTPAAVSVIRAQGMEPGGK